MSRTHDLTKGSIALHFKRLAVPAAIGMVFTTLYNVVDVFFAGLIGTDAQAGLAISFQAFFIFITFGFGLSSAMTALVGNAIGASVLPICGVILQNGFEMSTLFAVMSGIAGLVVLAAILLPVQSDSYRLDRAPAE